MLEHGLLVCQFWLARNFGMPKHVVRVFDRRLAGRCHCDGDVLVTNSRRT